MGVKKTTNQKNTNKNTTTNNHTRAQWNKIKKKKQQAVSLAQTPSHQLKWYWVEVLRALQQKNTLSTALDQVCLESRR